MLLHDGPKGARRDSCGVRSVTQTLHETELFLGNQMTSDGEEALLDLFTCFSIAFRICNTEISRVQLYWKCAND